MTQEYIKEAYKKLKEKLGRQPSGDELYKNTTVSNYFLLNAGFRNFNQLVEEMGDSPKQFLHGGKTEEQFLNSYGNTIRQINHIPSTTDWTFNKCKPAINNYIRKFRLTNWRQMADTFFNYAKDKDEWADIINLIPVLEDRPILIKEKQHEECYVYLMLDTKTGYYKIGISNKPEWREKTLQSEKPSIKSIKSKKFVNRRMAGNFEKALHNSFSHKRKRGEWFYLDQEEIDEIKITLT